MAAIEEAEIERRRELSCPNATISPAQDQIAAAIRAGDRESAMRLLEKDSSLMQACDRNGLTPLHIAAEESDEQMTSWLVERGANPNRRDRDGHTPLDRAALAADPRNSAAAAFPGIARHLLEHGAELTLFGAVATGNPVAVRKFVDADSPVLRRVGSSGGLLSLAVNHGHIEVVRLFLDLGADVDERIILEYLDEPAPSWGMPLWYAALANHFEIAKVLLDGGADPNANVYASGWPLRNAWNHADGRLKQLLLERGARPQPYMLAEAHDVEAARRLLEADASEDLAQELAWSAADNGCAAILEMALPRLTWPRDSSRWHWIIIQPIRGATADRADTKGHFACMEAILRHGIDPNVTRYGASVLHFAAGYHGSVSGKDRARFAAMLIDAGARLDLRDDLLKSTPLGWACRWGRRELVETLIARGARVDEPNAEAWATPRVWAEKMGRQEILVC